jgi:VWFA-related protein
MLRSNKRFLSLLWAVLALAAAWRPAVRAQAPPKPPAPPAAPGVEKADEGAIFRTDTRLVVLPVTVVDKSGHLITNLPRSAFQVFENNVQQEIRLFRREDVPVSMGLIVDNSGSMRDKREKVKEASLTLVKASNPQDEVFVVNFNDDAYLDTKDFTSDIKEMEEALSKIDSRGGTAMRDAVRMSIDHVKEKAKKDKRVLVVVTDGNDNASMITLENLVRAAQQSEVLIYCVGLLSEEEGREAKKAQRALKALAQSTGGDSYFPKDVNEVDRIAHQVARDIRNQYTIAYSPSNQKLDSTFRQIKVVANGPNRPTVRTRTGYYATPEDASKVKVTRNTPGLQ